MLTLLEKKYEKNFVFICLKEGIPSQGKVEKFALRKKVACCLSIVYRNEKGWPRALLPKTSVAHCRGVGQ